MKYSLRLGKDYENDNKGSGETAMNRYMVFNLLDILHLRYKILCGMFVPTMYDCIASQLHYTSNSKRSINEINKTFPS